MTKISAKDGIIVAGGYLLSPSAASYEVNAGNTMVEVTGFTDGWRNYISGTYEGDLAINFFWDSASNNVVDALKGLSKKRVTVIPDGYALGNPAISIESEQEFFNPGASPTGALSVGNIRFMTSSADGGPLLGWALAHGTITTTTTGTGFDDPTGGAVTARCAGVYHVWTPTSTDTYVVKIQHSTTLGSGYADLVTFVRDGTARGSEKVDVASGTINRYRRVVATRTGAAGDSFGFTVTFWHSA